MSTPRLTIALAVLAVVIAAHAPILFGGETWADPAHLTASLPARAEIAAALSGGRLPTWWDGVGLGVPFAANPDHAAFYPPQWLLAAAPDATTGLGDLLLLAHAWLAGLGAALVARRLGADAIGGAVAGVAFAAGGAVTSALPWGAPAFSTAALPFAMLAADHLAGAATRAARIRAAAILGAVLAVAILGGDWLIAADGAVAAAAVVALGGLGGTRAGGERGSGEPGSGEPGGGERGGAPHLSGAVARSLGWFAVAVGFALVLGAIALLPGAIFVGGDRIADGAASAMAPARLLEWLSPGALGAVREPGQSVLGGDTPWAASAYVGAPVLLFAILAVARGRTRHRLLGAAALGFTALALLGAARPALGDAAEKHLAAASLLLCALAGCGFTAAVASPLGRRPAAVCMIAAAALIVASLIVTFAEDGITARILDALRDPARPRMLDAAGADLDPAAAPLAAAIHEAVRRGLIAALAFGAVVLALVAMRSPRWRTIAVPAAAAIVAVQLAGHARGALPRHPRAAVDAIPPLLAPAAAAVDPGAPRARVYRPLRLPRTALELLETAPPDSATRFGLAYVRGADRGQAARLDEVWRHAGTAGERLLDLYDVRYAIVPGTVAIPAGMPVLARAGATDLVLAENEDRRPRAFVASRWRWHASESALVESLFPDVPGALALGTVQLVGAGDDAGPVGAAAAPARPCTLLAPHPGEARLICTADAPAYAVLLDAYADGWAATVDGRAAPLLRADAVVRAVPIDAGEHVVELRYRAPGLRAGALISAFGLVALVAALLWAARRPS